MQELPQGKSSDLSWRLYKPWDKSLKVLFCPQSVGELEVLKHMHNPIKICKSFCNLTPSRAEVWAAMNGFENWNQTGPVEIFLHACSMQNRKKEGRGTQQTSCRGLS